MQLQAKSRSMTCRQSIRSRLSSSTMQCCESFLRGMRVEGWDVDQVVQAGAVLQQGRAAEAIVRPAAVVQEEIAQAAAVGASTSTTCLNAYRPSQSLTSKSAIRSSSRVHREQIPRVSRPSRW